MVLGYEVIKVSALEGLTGTEAAFLPADGSASVLGSLLQITCSTTSTPRVEVPNFLSLTGLASDSTKSIRLGWQMNASSSPLLGYFIVNSE